jgi:hypothetical protein
MIAFDLICANGHLFEGWFENSESFEKQKSRNMISCPQCDSSNIKKVLSPISVKSQPRSVPGDSAGSIDYQKLAKEIWNYIQNEYEDMGTDFTKEALKIHYGVSEERNIRGTATESEENILKEEGIQFFKMPVFKKDKDKA